MYSFLKERPAGDWSDAEFFGNSKDIISTTKLIKKTQGEHDHRVAQIAVVNARLFDILINDWDRHDDQWRWAKIKGRRYQVLPSGAPATVTRPIS